MTKTRLTEFTSSGMRDNTPLVRHRCPRYHGSSYVSAAPSPPGDPYLVPGCGCRPAGENPLVTKTGRVLTETDVRALADEVERGYDGSARHPGKPKEGKP